MAPTTRRSARIRASKVDDSDIDANANANAAITVATSKQNSSRNNRDSDIDTDNDKDDNDNIDIDIDRATVNPFNMKNLETELELATRTDLLDMKDIEAQLNGIMQSPCGKDKMVKVKAKVNVDVEVKANPKTPLDDMSALEAELDQIQAQVEMEMEMETQTSVTVTAPTPAPASTSVSTSPKGLNNMQDLGGELNKILSTLPIKPGTRLTHVRKPTRIAQKIAPCVSNCDPNGNGINKANDTPATETANGNGNGKRRSSLSPSDRQTLLERISPSSLNLHPKTAGPDKEKEGGTSENGTDTNVEGAVLLCKFIQCALWDSGFRYVLLNYQFDAVLAAAGIEVKCILDMFAGWTVAQRLRLVSQTATGKLTREDFCKKGVVFAKTRGLLLADAMGLGKTIEGIGAAMLRNRIHRIQNEDCPSVIKSSLAIEMPTLIIVPNDAFINQWNAALVASGVDPSSILHFDREKKRNMKGDIFILVTRYSIMTEMRHVLKDEGSDLFPELPRALVDCLREQRSNGNKVDDVTVVLGRYTFMTSAKLFRTLIIDECHSLKNLLTYGGIGTAILGIHSDRVVPMSCTPFIDSTQDLATLMTFIDPTMKCSYKQWWKEAIKKNPSISIVEEVKKWRKFYFVGRQKDFLRDDLPRKTEVTIHSQCTDSELRAYEIYEDSFINTFEGFKNSTDPGLTIGKKDLTNILLMHLMNMRMSLIHPLVPKGREFTIRFSPSRRHLVSKFSLNLCVYCGVSNSKKLIGMPSDVCKATNSQCPHYIHEECLEFLCLKVDGSPCCPLCIDLTNSSHFASTGTRNKTKVSHPIFCKNIQVSHGISGFMATSKLLKIIEWTKSLPSTDKAVIYSFFEGSLDLVEGILVDELGINCARLDNDHDQQDQAKHLQRFKSSKDCKVLLATVQSCGAGLNIEEANHIAFLDRWFDATIHQQAIDRCYNLNQQKVVKVVYFDAAVTVDEIMKAVNDAMSSKASIRLVDGTEIGAQQRSIRYKDVSGPIYQMIKTVIDERRKQSSTNADCKNMLQVISETMDKQPAAVSPPSVLRSASFGSGNKSDVGKVKRKVAFAPLPNGFGTNADIMPTNYIGQTQTVSLKTPPSGNHQQPALAMYHLQNSTPSQNLSQPPYSYSPGVGAQGTTMSNPSYRPYALAQQNQRNQAMVLNHNNNSYTHAQQAQHNAWHQYHFQQHYNSSAFTSPKR